MPPDGLRAKIFADPTGDEWDAKAMTLVLKHTPAIERVAAALLARTTLTESEVKEALA